MALNRMKTLFSQETGKRSAIYTREYQDVPIWRDDIRCQNCHAYNRVDSINCRRCLTVLNADANEDDPKLFWEEDGFKWGEWISRCGSVVGFLCGLVLIFANAFVAANCPNLYIALLLGCCVPIFIAIVEGFPFSYLSTGASEQPTPHENTVMSDGRTAEE